MIHSTRFINPSDSEFLLDEGIGLSPEGIELSPDQINQAIALSESDQDNQKRWHTYLNALALIGFKQWLEAWAADLRVNDTTCSLYSPRTVNSVDAICNLQVGQFNVCLIAIGEFADPLVLIPSTAIDLPSLIPQFYVLVEVLEEEMQVRVYGYLRYDQLLKQRQSTALSTVNEFSNIPLDWFTLDASALLLDLRYLQPDAIPRPAAVSVDTASISQSFINAGLWLSDRLDALAEELSWMLMPVFTPALGLRNTRGRTHTIAQELVAQGAINIPAGTAGAYQELTLGELTLRLSAMTWELPPVEGESAWTLLVILEPCSESDLPIGTMLKIQDSANLSVEHSAGEGAVSPYLYAQVGGKWNEQFQVTIETANTVAVTLPSFGFSPYSQMG
jgi:hypothetical protein